MIRQLRIEANRLLAWVRSQVDSRVGDVEIVEMRTVVETNAHGYPLAIVIDLETAERPPLGSESQCAPKCKACSAGNCSGCVRGQCACWLSVYVDQDKHPCLAREQSSAANKTQLEPELADLFGVERSDPIYSPFETGRRAGAAARRLLVGSSDHEQTSVEWYRGFCSAGGRPPDPTIEQAIATEIRNAPTSEPFDTQPIEAEPCPKA